MRIDLNCIVETINTFLKVPRQPNQLSGHNYIEMSLNTSFHIEQDWPVLTLQCTLSPSQQFTTTNRHNLKCIGCTFDFVNTGPHKHPPQNIKYIFNLPPR